MISLPRKYINNVLMIYFHKNTQIHFVFVRKLFFQNFSNFFENFEIFRNFSKKFENFQKKFIKFRISYQNINKTYAIS